MIIEIIVFLVSTFVAYVIYLHERNKNKFRNSDVRFLPGFPLFGNVLKSTFLKQHILSDIEDVYKAFPKEKYVGYIESTETIVLIKDPELIKKITVKDFDHFMDHRQFFGDPIFRDSLLMMQGIIYIGYFESTAAILLIKDPELIKRITVKDFDHFMDHRQFFGDPIFNDSLFLMKGEKWRDMRATLSPAFTGSKMRQMVPFMLEASNDIVEYLKEKEGVTIDVDDLIRCYTNDVIASTAFGLRINTLKDRNNKFYKLGQSLIFFSVMQRIKAFLFVLLPYFGKYFRVFPQETTDFFTNLVTETMEYREKNNIERPDMIQLLMEADKGTLKSTGDENDKIGFTTNDEFNSVKTDVRVGRWTKGELAAQAFIFFFAGYESSASTLVMAIHELVLNPEVQEKLYQEVREFSKKGESLTYDTIAQLKYMDMVLNETMRKWSAALVLDRLCQKSYTLPPAHEEGKSYELKPGDVVYNCVNSTHMNEDYFPNPHKFDPERFSDENKHKIVPFTFMPFGIGPRNCIGLRFALMELKVLLFHIVANFQILKCEKTKDEIKLLPTAFNIKAVGGTFVKFNIRK